MSFAKLRDESKAVKEQLKAGLRENWRVIKGTVRDRLGVRPILPPKHRRGAAGAASLATTFAAARVVKGNVVLSRIGHVLAKGAAADKWQASNASQPLLPLKGVVPAGAKEAPISSSGRPSHSPLPASTNLGASSKLTDVGLDDARARERAAAEREEAKVWRDREEGTGALLRGAQAVAVPLFGSISHVFMHGLNRTVVFGGEKLQAAIEGRAPGQPLITVCNHVAAMDDPLVLSALVPPHMMLRAGAMRWTLCATDRCFRSAPMGNFFRALKVLPIVRGAGLEQKGMESAVAKLRRGDWVHVFPEGSRSRDGGRTLGPIRRGIGRLVAAPETEAAPLVVPFVHSGMQDVLVVGQKVPAVGKTVTVLVGDPIEVADLLAAHRAGTTGTAGTAAGTAAGTTEAALYDAIAARVADRMLALKAELATMVAALDESERGATWQRGAALEGGGGGGVGGERAAERAWEGADWEAQGLRSLLIENCPEPDGRGEGDRSARIGAEEASAPLPGGRQTVDVELRANDTVASRAVGWGADVASGHGVWGDSWQRAAGPASRGVGGAYWSIPQGAVASGSELGGRREGEWMALDEQGAASVSRHWRHAGGASPPGGSSLEDLVGFAARSVIGEVVRSKCAMLFPPPARWL